MPSLSPGPVESLVGKGVFALKIAEINQKAGNLKETLNWQATRTSAANAISLIGQTDPKLAAHLEAEYLDTIDKSKPGNAHRVDTDPKLEVAKASLVIQACKDPKTGPQFSTQLAIEDHKRISRIVHKAQFEMHDFDYARVMTRRLQVAYEAKQEQLAKR